MPLLVASPTQQFFTTLHRASNAHAALPGQDSSPNQDEGSHQGTPQADARCVL